MFQVTMQPSNLATSSRTEKREPKCKKQSARNKVQETKNKNRRTKSLEQSPRNKVLGAKAPIFRFLSGKIDQKSDFWNIVLLCSEREASCTFVGTRLRRPNKSDLPTADASERSKTAVCHWQNCVRGLILTKTYKMNNKTKVFQLRLTPEEAAMLKEKATAYCSVSHYIRCAVAEYSNSMPSKGLTSSTNSARFTENIGIDCRGLAAI